MNFWQSPLVVLLCITAHVDASAAQANPIRKVVTLMQNMQKEIAAEGAKEKELFEKFMCFCNGNDADLAKASADGNAKMQELSAKLKASEAEKAQTAQELAGHKSDRKGAESDLAEASTLRNKESSEFAAEKADSETNIAAMASAIPAIEKGMGAGASFVQVPHSDRVKKIVEAYPNVDPMDRRNVLAFMEQSADYAPQSGQIVGILKAMKDDMEGSLKSATADEEKSIAGFADLKASKEKEIEMATEAIETKMSRAGELAVLVVETKDALEDATAEVADTDKFLAQLKSQCATKEKQWAERSKVRSDEIAAISEAISILNDDDSLDVFKKAMPSALLQSVGFLQQNGGKASELKRAQALLAVSASSASTSGGLGAQMHLLLFTVRSKLRLKAKAKVHAADFGEVIKMVDDMVVLLGKHQAEDDKQKAWCEGEFDKSADEEKAAKSKLSATDAALSELSDQISTLMEEINTLTAEIAGLDKAVADATAQRKEEHAEYIDFLNMNQAALGLVEKAKNRMQKFYNPTLYKAPPKTEISMEEKALQAGTFVQVSVHRRNGFHMKVAPPPAPETFGGKYEKSEKSAGVLSLMDTIVKELENDMKDAEYEEKTAQKDYSDLMGDSQATRAQDAKSLTDKEGAKADLETKMVDMKEQRAGGAQDLKLAGKYIADLHTSCDFLMENFDLRKEARANEMDGLKNAKAVLSGASFSF